MSTAYLSVCQGPTEGFAAQSKYFSTLFPSMQNSMEKFRFSFALDIVRVWNKMPDNIYSATSLSSFRNKLKTHVFAKAYPL